LVPNSVDFLSKIKDMTRKNLEIDRPFRRARRAVVIAWTKGFAHGIASGCHEIAPADFDEVEAVTLSSDVDPRAAIARITLRAAASGSSAAPRSSRAARGLVRSPRGGAKWAPTPRAHYGDVRVGAGGRRPGGAAPRRSREASGSSLLSVFRHQSAA